MGNYDKARELLTYIGRTNGALTPSQEYSKLFKVELENVGESKEEDNTSVKAFMVNPLNRKNFLIFVMMYINCCFGYYLINFYVKYIPGDIFTN